MKAKASFLAIFSLAAFPLLSNAASIEIARKLDSNTLYAYDLKQLPFPQNLSAQVVRVPHPAWPPKTFNWEKIRVHYPWRDSHDDNRPDHARWRDGKDWAYCVHVRAGSRIPVPAEGTYPSSYLPRNCTDFLHTSLGTHRSPNILNTVDCGVLSGGATTMEEQPMYANEFPIDGNQFIIPGPAETRTFGRATAYVLGEQWNNLEHCRAGCETCFDAMAEFGAEQAVCRRKKGRATCAAGLVFGPPPALWCTTSPLLPGVQGNCTLNKRAPRWAEMGYSSVEDLMGGWTRMENEGWRDVKLYYMEGFPAPIGRWILLDSGD